MTIPMSQNPLNPKGLEAAYAAYEATGISYDAMGITAAIRAYIASQEAAAPSEEPVAVSDPIGWLAIGKPDFKPHFCRTKDDAEHTANNFVTYVKGCTGAEIAPLFAGQAQQFDPALKRAVPAKAAASTRSVLSSIIPATKGGDDLRKLIYDALDLSEELRTECADAVFAALSAQDTETK